MRRDKIFHPDFSNEPYWWATIAPSTDGSDDVPKHTDVAIIGSGYAGLSAALELSRNGVDVTVLEREKFGGGASTRNGGAVSGGHNLGRSLAGDNDAGTGASRHRERLSEAGEAFSLLESIIEREKINCDYRRSGRFVGAYASSHYGGMESKLADINEGVNAQAYMVPRERQHEEIASDFYYGGMVVERSSQLHPALYHHGLLDAARRAGARTCAEAEVQRIVRDSTNFRLTTARGELRADNVVVATNGYTGAVTPNLRRRIVPIASHIIATEPLPDDLAASLIPKGRTINDSPRVLCYYRMSPDGKRMLFGGRARFTQVGPTVAAPVLHRFMTERFPQLAGYRLTHAWTGNVAFAFDHLPHLGELDGLHYCLACNGSGIAMMTYLGHRTARKILAIDDTPVSVFEESTFSTMPLYNGRPWFLPVVGGYYRFLDRIDRVLR